MLSPYSCIVLRPSSNTPCLILSFCVPKWLELAPYFEYHLLASLRVSHGPLFVFWFVRYLLDIAFLFNCCLPFISCVISCCPLFVHSCCILPSHWSLHIPLSVSVWEACVFCPLLVTVESLQYAVVCVTNLLAYPLDLYSAPIFMVVFQPFSLHWLDTWQARIRKQAALLLHIEGTAKIHI